MVFLLTGGQSKVDKSQTVPNAKKLRDDGAEIYVIGFGEFTSVIEKIVQIVSFSPEDYLFRVKCYGDAIGVVKLVVKEINPGKYAVVKKIPSPC